MDNQHPFGRRETILASAERWQLREIPGYLRRWYRANGWWDDRTLGDLVASGTARSAGAVFRVRSGTCPWLGTVGEVDRAARALAATLLEQGVGPGDIIMFQMPNWAEAAVVFWAAAYLGAVVVPIAHFYGPKEIRYIIEAVDPQVVVTPSRFRATNYLDIYEAILAGRDTRWLVVSDYSESLPPTADWFWSLIDANCMEACQPVDPASPALIAFTSGTTSNPKGVVHSHQTLVCELAHVGIAVPDTGRPALIGAPVGHVTGMLSGLLQPLLRGHGIQLIDIWDPAAVLRAMTEERLSAGPGAPYFLSSLLDASGFSADHATLLPHIALGGAAIPPALGTRANVLGIKVLRAYGSTEHPSVTATAPDDPECLRLGTDGRPLPGVEVRVVDGELWTRGPDLCMGYTDPELTRRAFDKDGWFRTGDLAEIADGRITIAGRKGDLIIRGGENISPTEVEDALLTHPAIGDIAIIATPDVRFGERVTAVVSLGSDAMPPTLEDLREHLRLAGLARHKWPESLHTFDPLPRTASGKVQKSVIRQRIYDGLL